MNFAMTTLKESGHYAIAGFLYQLIGSGVAAFEICEGLQHDEEPSECLVLERFGQDAAVLPVDGSGKKPRLIQYKCSGKGETITPSTLREILHAFLTSARSLGISINQFAFELTTNRKYSPVSEAWVTAKTKDGSELENLIRKSSKADIADVPELAEVFRTLDCRMRTEAELHDELRNAGAGFGLSETEIKVGIDQLVGLLMRKAGGPGPRIIRREEVDRALAGYDNPYPLLSSTSIQLRRGDVAEYKRRETDGSPTMPRTVSRDIARAVFEHPVIVVVGDGGCGKSVAVSDAVTICLQDEKHPPGFGLIMPALNANAEATMDAVARWRNLAQQNDGQDFRRSISRLRRAFSNDPLLIVCIDAIDESEGKSRLPDNVQRFIYQLMDNAVNEHRLRGIPVTSVILACRRIEEVQKFSRGFSLPMQPFRIDVSVFDDDEITRLTDELDGSIRNRITEHFQLRDPQTRPSLSRTNRPVSANVLDIIRHPVIWRFFCESDVHTQHTCLDGRDDGL
jgi:hypothetical protein